MQIQGIARLIEMEIQTNDYDRDTLVRFSNLLQLAIGENAQRDILVSCGLMWQNDDARRSAVCEAALRVAVY